MTTTKQADWELDFYSRPIVDANGKKRWEALISSTEDFEGGEIFRWEKKCPADQVNSKWLADALKEALNDAENQGWSKPAKLRSWRTSMKTMIKKAAQEVDLEVIQSRRTYSLREWLTEREKNIYPSDPGYMTGPLAPPRERILNQPLPLPEEVRGDAWSFASLKVGALREANQWPIEFSNLLPIKKSIDDNVSILGLRLFSQKRALALAGWLGGLEPVKLIVEGNKLLLEAGQEDRWLVTDLIKETAKMAKQNLRTSKEQANGIQFISVQTTPQEKKFSGFWMLKDIPE